MMMRSPIQTAGDPLETRRSAATCLRAQSGWTIGRPGHALSSVLFALVMIVPLSGCLVGPNYTRPKVNAPTDFRGADGAAQQASFADLPWWEIFKDDTLKGLIQTALANNYDIRVATARVEQARQLAAQAHAQFYPAVGYTAGISGGKNEFLGSVAPNQGNTQGAFLAAVSAAWEVDLWGRIRRLNEAARARYLSTEEARRGVMLSLASDTAQAYFELLGLELQLEIARQNVDTFTQILKLFTQRLEGGVASKLDTSRAAAALANVAAAVPELERQIAIKENQINVLLGQNPAGIPHSAKLLEEIVPPDIPVGLPSALLERRPDVLSAEEDVRAANALIGVATAAFFPQVGLTTFLGHASTPLEDFASGKANAWSFAGNIAGPIYQGGALKARKREAIANWDEARLRYEQVALFAFQDVSNALISRSKYESILAEQAQSVRSYEEAVRIALLRYNNGKASYFEVLDAQQQLYPAQNAAALTELNRRVVIVQLYRALGGGWNLNDAQWMGTQPVTAPQQPPAKQNP
jgi:multidrug efflux system outer membrane protein